MQRCAWVNLKNELYVRYHDEEWGVRCENDQELYELLILESFQAGLSWECVLNKREAFRVAFEGFSPTRVADFDDKKVEELLADKGIIRCKQKILAAINNTKIFLSIKAEYKSFKAYLEGFAGEKTVYEPYTLRTTSPLSDMISKDLKKRGMKYVGSTIIYSYLQAIGIINGHGCECELCKAPKTQRM